MGSNFAILDWCILSIYLAVLFGSGWFLSRRHISDTKDFFLAKNGIPTWVATLSIVATAQSAATFLGVPNQSYTGNWTYMASFLGGLVAAMLIATYLIPRFYQMQVTTVYELLEHRFGSEAKKASSLMYLVGRVFASGARLYMAGLAIAMILFGDIGFVSVFVSVSVIALMGLAYTWVGGIRSVVWGDVIQLGIYVGAAIFVIFHLLSSIPADMGMIIAALQEPGNGATSKLQVFDFRLTRGGGWTIWSILTGYMLLTAAAWGMDQDMTQRMLACKNAQEGAKSAWKSIIYQIPVVLVFLIVGSLLYIFYQRPDIMGETHVVGDLSVEGQIKLTTIMYYILYELPTGLRGLIAVGVVAAAFSTVNSGLNSMSSVAVEDLYRPFLRYKGIEKDDEHFVKAGRFGMFVVAIVLSLMGALCYFWQRYTDTKLLDFALSVMSFAYSGLLGVYITALFSKRGNKNTVLAALIFGFLIVLFMQAWIWTPFWTMLGAGEVISKPIGFFWVLCIATGASTLICISGAPQSEIVAEQEEEGEESLQQTAG